VPNPLNVRAFDNDLAIICKRVAKGQPEEVRLKLNTIRSHLLELYRRNIVKINHSVIELLCAGKLIAEGYDVKVEHPVSRDLVCDVYGSKGDGNVIVEIETGFVPPSHALDPARYCYSRIISKTARYSQFANRFVLGTTTMNILPIPNLFENASRFRSLDDVKSAKAVCDIYYSNPAITLEQITYAQLHSIFVLDVDHGIIRETTPDEYLEETSKKQKNFNWS
jgi:hypothetical protein